MNVAMRLADERLGEAAGLYFASVVAVPHR
jgi:hypothetical protein